MNHVVLIGRLTKDPEAVSEKLIRFTLAVDRRKSDDTDFISCIAFGKTIEFVQKYLNKGMKIALSGRIQTGSYMDKNDQRHFTTDVIADTIEFAESKKQEKAEDGFQDLDNTGLPFYG